jgi:hypothetical protein
MNIHLRQILKKFPGLRLLHSYLRDLDVMHSDLSPFFHPVGSRVRWSFEPIRLGGATGWAVEPCGKPASVDLAVS